MKCVKCGNEIEENAKFCGACGSPVEEVVEDINETIESTNTAVEEKVNKVTAESQPSKKKMSGKEKGIIIGVIVLVAAIVACLFLGFSKFFGKESYSASVENVKKSIVNLANKLDESATVNAKMTLKSSLINLDLGAALEYQLNNDKIGMHASIDPIALLGIDKMDAYFILDRKNMSLYVPGSIFTMINEDIDLDADKTYKVELPLETMGITNVDEIFSNLGSDVEMEANENADLSKVLTESNFKYAGESNGLKKYTLKVDKKYLEKLSKEFGENVVESDTLDEIGDMNFNMNFYVNKEDCLEKIEIDMTEMIKKSIDGAFEVEKMSIEISFTKLNSTTVEVPANIKNSSVDLLESFGSNLDYNSVASIF